MSDNLEIVEMCLDITEYPVFNNYHADREYLAAIKADNMDVVFLNIRDMEVSIPLFKRFLESDLFDLFSPLGFQPYIDRALWPDLLIIMKDGLKEMGTVSLYILSRNDLSTISAPHGFDLSHYRTNYYIDLQLSYDEWLDQLKRDSRQRLRKAIKTIRYKVELTTVSDEFVMNYHRIAKARIFPKRYLLSWSDFVRFSNVNNMVYLELRERRNNDFIAGGFFGCHGDDVDYLFGADNQQYRDAIRLLINEARGYFRMHNFKRLYLGGGVKEGDSLARFKQRMGTREQRCSAVRAVINIEQAERLYGNRFSNEWFKGFFPPYVKAGGDE